MTDRRLGQLVRTAPLELADPGEFEAYAVRMAGCGPMGQAAILEATHRAAKASPAGVAA